MACSLPTSHLLKSDDLSHLLGAGVSDNLGVPSVSLLSEDAVASESVEGKGWSVGKLGGVPYLPQRGVISTLQKGSGNLKGTQVLLWRGPQLPQLLKMPFTP